MLKAVITALTLTRHVVVGHSMGDKTAELLASRRPSALSGLVLTVQAYFAESADDYLSVCHADPSKQLHAKKPLVFGASSIFNHNGVCNFTTHPVSLTGWGTDRSRLEPQLGGSTEMMTQSTGACPPPFSGAYTVSYGVSTDEFNEIMVCGFIRSGRRRSLTPSTRA
jgi:hypothetical protein